MAEAPQALRSRLRMSDQDERPEPVACPPCRGTGRVISNLGGTQTTITCPWCEGNGTFDPEHDAQAARLDERSSAAAAD